MQLVTVLITVAQLLLQLAGAVEFQMRAFPQAETLLSKALQAAPGLPIARVLLAQTYMRTGQPNKTEVEFTWTDPKPEPGKTSYYYVRGEQSPGPGETVGELVWASPMWIKFQPSSR